VETKRIVLVDGSHLLSEMLQRVINRTEDLVVVDILKDLSTLPGVIEAEKPDWVIFSQATDGNLPEEFDTLFEDHPTLHVLTITIDTGDINIDWISRQKTRMDVTTVEDLEETLRNVPVKHVDHDQNHVGQPD
jgi:DNA-binding NarL/FixJ family response regulator